MVDFSRGLDRYRFSGGNGLLRLELCASRGAGVGDKMTNHNLGGRRERILHDRPRVEIGAGPCNVARRQINAARTHIWENMYLGSLYQPGLTEHAAIDVVKRRAGKTVLGLVLAVAHAHGQGVVQADLQCQGQVKGGCRKRALVLTNELAIDEDVFHCGSSFQH